jgi:hypothetical protein
MEYDTISRNSPSLDENKNLSVLSRSVLHVCKRITANVARILIKEISYFLFTFSRLSTIFL